MRFFLICLCAAQLFCAFTLVCDCIFMLFCFVVLLSCHVFFVVLPVSFCSDFTLLPVLCLILPSHVLPSRFGLAPSVFNLSYDVLFCSCRYRLPLCVAFSFVSFESFSVDPFFFHASLLYESPRRKPG